MFGHSRMKTSPLTYTEELRLQYDNIIETSGSGCHVSTTAKNLSSQEKNIIVSVAYL